MKPIRPGDRGPAVEDIQRRLLVLGYDLGRTGVDGVYLGATGDAIRSFQERLGLAEDGVVAEQTWSALVDATFTLGDRVLYLRLPHFHGADVRVLQDALNALGFSCGVADGIFGAFSERGVREFQRNSGLPADGIVGAETVAALNNLRHVWDGKESAPHSAAKSAPARAAEVLRRAPIVVRWTDESGQRIARRVVNLALATTEDALVTLVERDDAGAGGSSFVVTVGSGGTDDAVTGRPVVMVSPIERLASRVVTAISSPAGCEEIEFDLTGVEIVDVRDEQSVAVALLDALCMGFDRTRA